MREAKYKSQISSEMSKMLAQKGITVQTIKDLASVD
jgi:hypothetical protein